MGHEQSDQAMKDNKNADIVTIVMLIKVDPTDPCAFDEDYEAAAVTRKRVLTEASRSGAVVIPAHYPGHGGATVVARGDAFMVDNWLESDPI